MKKLQLDNVIHLLPSHNKENSNIEIKSVKTQVTFNFIEDNSTSFFHGKLIVDTPHGEKTTDEEIREKVKEVLKIFVEEAQ